MFDSNEPSHINGSNLPKKKLLEESKIYNYFQDDLGKSIEKKKKVRTDGGGSKKIDCIETVAVLSFFQEKGHMGHTYRDF